MRTLTDVKGTVNYDKATQQYRIQSPVASTLDEVNVGVLCGELPADLRADNRQVVFSGTYKEYANAPTMPAGYTIYYLSLSKVSAQ